jgi:hypothetical protein
MKNIILLSFISLFSLSTLSQTEFKLKAPKKYLDSQLILPAEDESRFPIAQIKNGEFVKLKKKEWQACRQTANEVFGIDQFTSPILPLAEHLDPIELFFEKKPYLKTLQEMEEQKLLRAQLESIPWSGDYWAYASGILAARPFDPAFEEVDGWQKKYEYYKANPSPLLLEKQSQDAMKILSPAEKYDLLVGDDKFQFTESMWAQGKVYFDETGEVETWMGICHGWAAAAIVEPRPENSVDVPSFDQKWNIHFYPAEIKGLVSYSWATNPFPTKFLGERCNNKNPELDENGRIKDRECFDLNPATWHTVVVNHIGVLKKSFVMDATYDFEVWNQPVLAYSYSYFNPETKKKTPKLEDAIIPISKFKSDKFKKYRSSKAAKVVGIQMRVAYVVESSADNSEQHSEGDDMVRYVEYFYDLELDKDNNLIGGEWHDNGHPDFLWVPYENAVANSYFDKMLAAHPWPSSKSVPEIWSEAGKASNPHGVILNSISKGLIERSKSKEKL